jgi:hypothetical protein
VVRYSSVEEERGVEEGATDDAFLEELPAREERVSPTGRTTERKERRERGKVNARHRRKPKLLSLHLAERQQFRSNFSKGSTGRVEPEERFRRHMRTKAECEGVGRWVGCAAQQDVGVWVLFAKL